MTDLPVAPETAAPAAVTAVEKPKRGRKWVIRTDAASDKCDVDDLASVRLCARRLGTTEEAIRAAIAEALRPPPPPEARPDPIVTVRDKLGTRSFQLAGFLPALQHPSRDPTELLTWEDERLAALDVDVLPERPFSEDEVAEWCAHPGAPACILAWRTKSGGMRYIFESSNGARTAALHALLAPWSGDSRIKRVEIIKRTFRPPPGATVRRPPEGSYNWLERWIGTGGVDSVAWADVEAWLDARDLPHPPGRAPHAKCPIWSEVYEGRDPVVITEEGIFCHHCASHRGSGWRPWSRILDAQGDETPEPEPDILRDMAQGYVHWEHARFVLAALYPAFDPKHLRLGYSALMEILHPEEAERVAAAFAADLCFVRGSHHWIRTTDWRDHASVSQRSVARLPAFTGSAPLCDLALGGGPLPGYVPIIPVSHAVDRPCFMGPGRSLLVPRPIPMAEPAHVPQDWEALEVELLHVFEGAGPLWCKAACLVVAGAIQAQRGQPSPPLTLLHGLPGAGKGVLVALARGVLGSPDADVNLQASPEKIAEAIGNGLENGATIIFADEVGKAGGLWRESAPLLKLSASHSWRKLFVGYCTAPVTAHLVLATSTRPSGTLTLPEFNRRLGWVDLPRVPYRFPTPGGTGELMSNSWKERVERAFGVPALERIRESPAGAGIAVALIREAKALLDRHGSECWATLVRRYMGDDAVIPEDRPEAELLSAVVRGIYAAWRDTGVPLTAERYSGWLAGWVEQGSEEAPLNRAARVLSLWLTGEETSDELHARLMRLETADVVELCGLPAKANVRLETRRHGRKVYLRFRGPWKERAHWPPLDGRSE